MADDYRDHTPAGEIPKLENNRVNLVDYQHILRQVCPGAFLQEDVARFGLIANYQIRTTFNMAIAPNEKAAEEMVRGIGEDLRLQAIRDLGVKPILDAYERRIRILERTLSETSARLDQTQSRLLEAQDKVDEFVSLARGLN